MQADAARSGDGPIIRRSLIGVREAKNLIEQRGALSPELFGTARLLDAVAEKLDERQREVD